MIKAYLLYTGEDGLSDFKEGFVSNDIMTSVVSVLFKETVPHSVYDWHPAPTTQYVVTLTGTLEFEMTSGKKFILRPGEILIAMDTTGPGHKWQMLGDDPWKRMYVLFNDANAINFQEQ
jgi:quercetin dioxygenase-like cupin family protein